MYVLNTLGWDPKHPASFFFFFSALPLLLLYPVFLLSFIALNHMSLFFFLHFICLLCLWLMSLHVWGTWYLKKVESKHVDVKLECFEKYLLFIFNVHSFSFSLFNVLSFALVLRSPLFIYLFLYGKYLIKN